MTNNINENHWLSGMMGLIVGDALGVPVQFRSREWVRNREKGPVTGMEGYGTFNMPEGTWSDDSSLALATLSSILDKGAIDAKDIMQRFVEWNKYGKYTPYGRAFDQGLICLDAIGRFEANGDICRCGAAGEMSNGNGSLMRILPVCLYYYDRQKKICTSDDEAIYSIHTVGGLTHNHLRSNMCCGVYYYMVKSIIDGRKNADLMTLLQDGIDKGMQYYRKDISNLAESAHLGRLFDLKALKNTQVDDIKSTGYVIATIEAAIWCLITTDSLKDCLLKAVNLGDDTDTVAAIAGGLAGLYYGYDSIPEDWLKVIKRRDWIEDLCSRAMAAE